VVVTRCSNNYGPYQFPEKVIPLFVTNLLDGKKVRSTATVATCGLAARATTTAWASTGVREGTGRRGLPHRRRAPS
jgi:hypothetical protein